MNKKQASDSEEVMAPNAIDKINQSKVKAEGVTVFAVGDNVSVHVKIVEGGKERVQVFSGTVIGKTANGAMARFTVRRVSHGVGVERVFPLHSPHIAKIEVEGSRRVRRAKLYYLRTLSSRNMRLKAKSTPSTSGSAAAKLSAAAAKADAVAAQ